MFGMQMMCYYSTDVFLSRLAFLLLPACILVLPLHESSAQLLVSDTIPAVKLVRDHFLGTSANITNIKVRGVPRSIGFFDGRTSNIGIDQGILMTTGHARAAAGPNVEPSITSYSGAPEHDSDLVALLAGRTYDICALEFDVIPTRAKVSFDYVFASEEYEEFVGSLYNDGFAFFISGPGIIGKQNIALIPNSSTPVSINNVNHVLNTQYYLNNVGGSTVEYDGFTSVLSATANVTPCETYRMKLIIADVQDSLLDSGVFLRGGSFNAGDAFNIRALRDAYEKCARPGLFEILRSGNVNLPVTITIELFGSAVAGSDYVPIIKAITFRPGQASAIIEVYALEDGIADSGESVILHVPDICNTGLARDTLYILESEPLSISFPNDTIVCKDDEVTLMARFSGGNLFYWEGGMDGDSSLTLSSPAAGTYRFHLTDTLTGCRITSDCTVYFDSLLYADAGPDAILCPGGSLRLGAPPTPGAPPLTYEWEPPTGLDDPRIAEPVATPTMPTTWIVKVTNASGCATTDTVMVSISDISVDAGPDLAVCPGEIASLTGSLHGGRAPYSIQWYPPYGLSSINILNPVARPDSSMWYLLQVVDRDGCGSTDSVYVTVYPERTPHIQVVGSTVLCVGDSALLDAGTLFVSYKWNTGESTRTIKTGVGGYYWAEGISIDGCTCVSDTVLIQVVDKPRPIITGPFTVCEGQEVRYSVSDAGSALYQWSVTGGFIVTGEGSREIAVRWDASGTWSVAIEVVLGSAFCRGDTMITVLVLPTPDPFIAPAGPVALCPGDSIVLQASQGFTSYAWTTGASTSRIVVSKAGKYAVTVTSAGGCTGASPEVEVLLYPKPSPRLRFLTPQTVCEGDSVIVEVEGDFAVYAWSNGATDKRITLRADAQVWAEVRSQDGCAGLSDTAQVRIAPAPRPIIIADGPLEFCEGDSVVLRTSELYAAWAWSTGQSGESITARSSGVYAVRVTNSEGCSGEATFVEVLVHPNPPVPVIAQSSDRLHAPAGFIYQWFVENGATYREMPGETAESIVFEYGIWYRVRVETQFGCSALSPPFRVPAETQALSTVGLPILEAEPGQHLVIPLSLISQNYLKEAGVVSFSATIRFNASMLSPTGTTPTGRLNGGERIIDLAAPYLDGSTVLSDLHFVATLGNAVTTPLILERFAWNNGTVRVTHLDGRLDMPVCREGVERLFDGTGRLRLAQNHPNPFNSMTVIEYEVIERGYTQLYVLDALGRRVATLLHEGIEPGAYRVVFDASTLPSGLYWAVLKTPTQLVTKPMRLLK